MEDGRKIVNIIICYNNSREIIKYLGSMEQFPSIDNVAFVVVKNAGAEEDSRAILDYRDKSPLCILYVDPGKNLGYMNGLIYGYKKYREIYSKPLYVIMSNTDIEIADKNYYSNLLTKRYDRQIGCIGPSVYVKEKNIYDNPVCENRRNKQEIDSIINKFSIPGFSAFYVYLSTIKRCFIRKKKTDSRYVYEVHGCYFILTGEFADTIKELKYGVLMYSEEAFIAELILMNNYKTYYDSTLEIIHLEHSVTKLLKCSKIAKYIRDSMIYIRETFYE